MRIKNMISITVTGLAMLASGTAFAGTDVRVESFPVRDVRLTDGMFRHAQDMDKCYLMALDPDRLLAPYRKGAGLEPKAGNYGNWENTGLDGHIGGHYLSALSYMYAATGDEEIGRRLDYVLAEMKACQDAAGDGYLCGVPDGRKMWDEIRRGDIRAEAFGLNNRWVPLYNIHKTFAGLRDAYLLLGREDAGKMFISLADWMYRLTADLSEEQMQDMLRSEHGGLNEVFADAAAISGDRRFLELAHRFSQKLLLEPLLKGEDRLTGMHANTQIPKVIGYKRIADLEGSKAWSDAAVYFWETVVDKRSISIGGNSVREHFHPSDDFGPMLTSEQGPETCNTYNMLRLTKMLYETSADASYMDFYERALYNHILSTINPVQGGFVYFTPMRPGHYRVYSQPQTSFWCCVGSGMENHARYGEMIYGHEADKTLYVNLFIPSTLKWGDVEVEQRTSFPDSDETSIVIKAGRSKRFSVKFRIPEWTDCSEVEISVNGKKYTKTKFADGYAELNEKWKNGDTITVRLPMELRTMALPDGSDNYSFLYGPVVLGARLGVERQDGMYADESRGGHIAGGPRLPLQEMPVIVGDRESLTAHVSRSGDGLKFTLSGVYPEKYENMVLEPFYRIHEARYMVYWPLLSSDELAGRIARMAEEEKAAQALEARTADKVICGEQQPESDHFVKMDKSNIGDDEGVHWREARGSFSYELRNPGGKADAVMLKFVPGQRRAAKVYADGVPVLEIGPEQQASPKVVEAPLTESLRGREKIEVRIESAGEASVTPRFHEVRLVNQKQR